MSTAINPEKARQRKRKKNRAQDKADTFTIYVNPIAKDDPEKLQARAHPILLAWKDDEIHKEQILRAVLFYTEGYQAPVVAGAYDPEALLEAFSERMERAFSRLRLMTKGDEQAQEELTDMSDSLLDFTSEFMSYSGSGDED